MDTMDPRNTILKLPVLLLEKVIVRVLKNSLMKYY